MNTSLSSKRRSLLLPQKSTKDLRRGFAAKAPAKVLESVQTWGNDYHAGIHLGLPAGKYHALTLDLQLSRRTKWSPLLGGIAEQ
jgi:hypothetical protein